MTLKQQLHPKVPEVKPLDQVAIQIHVKSQAVPSGEVVNNAVVEAIHEAIRDLDISWTLQDSVFRAVCRPVANNTITNTNHITGLHRSSS